MRDWAAPLIASALFGFLSPGWICQMPGKNRAIDFMNMKTSIAAIVVHAVIYEPGVSFMFLLLGLYVGAF
ncbi:Protein of unknown function DUF3339 [Dillenia turbinata]|uniref:Uncharacterized protein n=1 Tax=Dillenia turbinata TaxID=194707 RepID=A0AAN8YUC9_9MAGN